MDRVLGVVVCSRRELKSVRETGAEQGLAADLLDVWESDYYEMLAPQGVNRFSQVY